MRYLMAMIAVLVLALMLSTSLAVPRAPDTVGSFEEFTLYDGPVGIAFEASDLVLDVDVSSLNTDALSALTTTMIQHGNNSYGPASFGALTMNDGSGDDALSGFTRSHLL